MKLQGRDLSVKMQGDDVALLHEELSQLGFNIPVKEQARVFFGPGTQRAVKQFQEKHGLEPTGIVDKETAALINHEIGSQPPPEPFVVTGRVFTHEYTTLGGVRVVAVDKYVGGEDVLGEAVTDAQGSYTIRFASTALRKRGKKSPDIQIKVTPQKDDSKLLAVSDIVYNAGIEETVNVVVPAGMLERPAEYQRVTAELSVHLGRQVRSGIDKRLARLQEDEERQDITYLANKTGWDARLVAMVATANRLGTQTGVRPEFYYALFRAGLPANDDLLSQTNPETVQSIWNRAIEEKIIPEALKADIPQHLERFKQAGVGRFLEPSTRIGVSSLNELLGISLGADNARKQRFAQLYYDNRDHLTAFWNKARLEFGDDVAGRLQLDGKLGFLTVNNATLIERLRQDNDLHTPLGLIQKGLYRREAWDSLLADGIAIPQEIPGQDDTEKKANYVDFMVNQLKLSYPTAVVAEMIKNDELPLNVHDGVKATVYQFLTDQQGRFELGVHPVERYLRQHNLTLTEEPLAQVKRLQRVYQISPSDDVMAKLLQNDIDSAYALVRYDEKGFVDRFKNDLGGEATARLTYAKAHQVHHTALNIAIAYLTSRTAPPLYAVPSAFLASGAPEAPDRSDVPAAATLETLFGELDYCACEHCRSVLSPAAYLVDLLHFIDLPQDPPQEHPNPLDVLLERRPDIQHLQLTCENTNTVLPSIDLVNEILEYFVVNGVANNNFSLRGFKGYNVEDGTSREELLANPQFVNDLAYRQLRKEEQVFPLSLPFHQPLEALRRYFDHFDVPLHAAMEQLRKDESLDVPADADSTDYAWRDILIERLDMSRQEYAVLTDSTIPLPALYGEDSSISEDQLIINLSNVKTFARRVGISYEELIEITRTQFINPHSHLIPKLEKLRVNFTTSERFFATIKDFNDGGLSDEQFEVRLPAGLDAARYGGDVKQWIRDNYERRITDLIVLSDPTGSEDVCSFDQLELRYALPDFDNNRLKASEFLKLVRFIRLWKKLGWSIEYTDKAIKALYPPSQRLAPGDDEATVKAKLDEGFAELILRLANLTKVLEQLELHPKSDLLRLLACWSTIDTHGSHSLYRQMFLNPAILRLDGIFGEDGYGNYPKDSSAKIVDHAEALQAAFNLNRAELDLLLKELNFDGQSELTLKNISSIFRYGYLARTLHLSIRELLALKAMSGIDPFAPLEMSGIDPFAPLEPIQPAMLRFIDLAHLIERSGFKVSKLMYLLQHADLSGEASPDKASILAFAKTIRDDLVRINREHAVADDPTGEVARAKMALVYGSEVTDTFFGLLNGSSSYSVTYDHDQPELQADIRAVTDKLTYDDFQKQLSFRGVMTEAVKRALENVVGVSNEFRAAVEALFKEFQTFFDRFPDLEGLYNDYEASNQPIEEKRSALLEKFLPTLRQRLKHQQVRQTVSAQLGTELSKVTLLLETPALLHALGQTDQAAVMDFLNLETQGVSAQYSFSKDEVTLAGINYPAGGTALPQNPEAPGDPISGVWRWYLEAPDNGSYNFYVEADADAVVSLTLEQEQVDLSLQNGVRQNQKELKAGQLYAMQLTVKNVKDRLVLKWESKGLARQSIPADYLYPAVLVERFAHTYLRLLKAIAIAEELELSEIEITYFGTQPENADNGDGWLNLNALPVSRPSDTAATTVATLALFAAFTALLRYGELKAALRVRDDALVRIFNDPKATTEDGQPLLGQVTGWDTASLNDFFARFGLSAVDLSRLEHFMRIKQAFDIADKLGVGAAALVAGTTNEPTPDMVRNLQGVLRARYDERAWLKVLQPINDELRRRQRDALVAYVLHKLQQSADTQHIDTPDKLFEHFLIDVQIDPCMQTSRIRQAISTVQLFIQRCLLNLEWELHHVAPSSINAQQWEWMKRYRVWEANRKVFLFPENWLEPELRDDKSPFFKDLESELLQSDITEDTAATALVHYLEKLDEVAKLEICGMFHQENQSGSDEDDTTHVIGRTAGAGRKYYYRRLEPSGWTPWETVDLNIEDNPVLPVVWRGRLFVFWLSVMQEAPTDQNVPAGATNDKPLAEFSALDLKSITTHPTMRVSVTLYWSEYYNGKWQPSKTSDVNKPIELDQFPLNGSNKFDRAELTLSSAEGEAGELYIHIEYPGVTNTYFKLYNTHSLPVRRGDESLALTGIVAGSISSNLVFSVPKRSRTLSTANGVFVIDYYNPPSFLMLDGFDPDDGDMDDELFEQHVLRRVVIDAGVMSLVEPRHAVQDIFEAPFFFQDRRYVFFVQPVESTITVAEHLYFGTPPQPARFIPPEIDPVIIRPDLEDIPLEEIRPPRPVDPSPIASLRNRTIHITRAIRSDRPFIYNGRRIEPGGLLRTSLARITRRPGR